MRLLARVGALCLACALLAALHVAACAPALAVQGPARLVVTGDRAFITLCESGERYQVAVTTSNAAFDTSDALERARAEGGTHVYVSGHESTASPSTGPGVGADRRMSVGAIRTIEAPDGC